MRPTLIAVLLGSLIACGGDEGGGGSTADAVTVPTMLTISGAASKRMNTTESPGVGVMISAYRTGDETTAVATATTNAQGNYTLTIQTNGQPLDGYLKATLTGYVDTYLYPPKPLTEDFAGASINLLTTGTLDLLSGLLCGASQQSSMGVIALLVVDAADTALSGATVASTPAASKVCYNEGGNPNRNATMTDTTGIAYLFNITGAVTVSAMKTGTTFPSHGVKARAGTFTTTVIQP